MRPMLAEKLKKHPMEKLRYPVWGTPKLDGFRCLTMEDAAPRTRSLMELPNRFVRSKLLELDFPFLDGELIVPDVETFGRTGSAFSSFNTQPVFEYLVFDLWKHPELPYLERLEELQRERVLRLAYGGIPAWMKLLLPERIDNPEELQAFLERCLDANYEGIVFRTADSPYKFNRSTMREQYMVAIKPFEDTEGLIVGGYEQLHNDNVATLDERGFTKRSKAKAGLVSTGLLGGFWVRPKDGGPDFKLGSGYTLKERDEYMRRLPELIERGFYAKYKSQVYGAKVKPRSPIFLDIRSPEDMS